MDDRASSMTDGGESGGGVVGGEVEERVGWGGRELDQAVGCG